MIYCHKTLHSASAARIKEPLKTVESLCLYVRNKKLLKSRKPQHKIHLSFKPDAINVNDSVRLINIQETNL